MKDRFFLFGLAVVVLYLFLSIVVIPNWVADQVRNESQISWRFSSGNIYNPDATMFMSFKNGSNYNVKRVTVWCKVWYRTEKYPSDQVFYFDTPVPAHTSRDVVAHDTGDSGEPWTSESCRVTQIQTTSPFTIFL